MKILADLNLSSYDRAPGHTTLVWPDSVMVRNGKPIFLPSEEEAYWVLEGVCVKLNRLGKAIAPQFASEYFSEAAPLILILNQSATDALIGGRCPEAGDIMFDGCIAVGDFISLPTDYDEASQLIDMKAACEALVNTSRYLMLKIGDLVFTLLPNPPVKAEINSRFHASILNETLLSVKIK